MTTRRKIREHWTEVKRIVDGQVKQTVCCCPAPGGTASGCAMLARAVSSKTRCQCDCHRGRTGSGEKK